MWFDKNYKTKLKVFKLAIAQHYILMHFSTLGCKLLLNEELAIITFSLAKKVIKKRPSRVKISHNSLLLTSCKQHSSAPSRPNDIARQFMSKASCDW